MEITARGLSVSIAVLLALSLGGIVLQVFLSKREGRWPGLVLPILGGLYALAMASCATAVPAALAAFFFCGIPPAVYLLIYFLCREKRKKKRGVDRMNIQDL